MSHWDEIFKEHNSVQSDHSSEGEKKKDEPGLSINWNQLSEANQKTIGDQLFAKVTAKRLVESTLMNQAKMGRLEWAIREHNAEKRGPHLDLVIGLPMVVMVPDFAIQNGIKTLTDLIGALSAGRKVSAFPMELHPSDPYLTRRVGYTKIEPLGYGAGPFKIVDKGYAVQKGDHHSFFLQGLGECNSKGVCSSRTNGRMESVLSSTEKI